MTSCTCSNHIYVAVCTCAWVVMPCTCASYSTLLFLSPFLRLIISSTTFLSFLGATTTTCASLESWNLSANSATNITKFTSSKRCFEKLWAINKDCCIVPRVVWNIGFTLWETRRKDNDSRRKQNSWFKLLWTIFHKKTRRFTVLFELATYWLFGEKLVFYPL